MNVVKIKIKNQINKVKLNKILTSKKIFLKTVSPTIYTKL